MANTPSEAERDVQSWLKVILKDENLKELSVNILGNSENGDGYLGDVVFVTANGVTEDNISKVYNLVLKCSKKSQALRDSVPIKDVFKVEILMYQQLNNFVHFQKEKSVKDLFDSYPKYYGSFTSENMEVIALENMKSQGYELWPKKNPLTRKHIDLVVTEYAKFHATSLAMKQQQPEEYQTFVDTLRTLLSKIGRISDVNSIFGSAINEAYKILKDDLAEHILKKWKGLVEKIDYVFKDLLLNHNELKVINHGDCWNNNFMYLYEKSEEKVPVKVTLLDWQLSQENTPVRDLSYFLFCSLSKEDMDELDDILSLYHQSFINQLKQLRMKEAETLYSFDQFLKDWKKFSIYGVMMASLMMKIVSTDKDEAVDIAEAAESGSKFGEGFSKEIKDKENYKRRIKPVVEYFAKEYQ